MRSAPLVTMMYVRWILLMGHSGGKYGRINCKTTFSSLGRHVFLYHKYLIILLGAGGLEVAHW